MTPADAHMRPDCHYTGEYDPDMFKPSAPSECSDDPEHYERAVTNAINTAVEAVASEARARRCCPGCGGPVTIETAHPSIADPYAECPVDGAACGWAGVASETVPAVADQVPAARPIVPARNDAVDAWLRERRGMYAVNSDAWDALDAALDDYRLHADVGHRLHVRVFEGGHGEVSS